MLRGLAALLLAVTALVSPAEGRDFGPIQPNAHYAFRDDAWIGGDPLGRRTFLQPLWRGAQDCAERLRSCTREFRRAELFTSTPADASPNRVIDLNGHALGVSRVVTIERVETSGFFHDFGVAATWDVGGEQVFDDSGWRAWETLYPDASPNGKWLPILSYAFAGAAPQAAIPEASTWELIGVGFVALASAAMIRRRLV